MTFKYYRIGGKRYNGMYHVRGYQNKRYFHVGRFRTEEEAKQSIEIEKKKLCGTINT